MTLNPTTEYMCRTMLGLAPSDMPEPLREDVISFLERWQIQHEANAKEWNSLALRLENLNQSHDPQPNI